MTKTFVVRNEKDSFGGYAYIPNWRQFYKVLDAIKLKPGESARVKLVRVRKVKP